jgi:hypothetical protein
MQTDFSGDYLNFDGTSDGDIAEILNEGKIEYNDILKKEMFNIQVKVNDKIKTYSPNNTAGKSLQEHFGKDSKDWVGRKFQIFHVDKKMLIKPLKT